MINLKTAKALGLDVPLQLQQRADEVIEQVCQAIALYCGCTSLQVALRGISLPRIKWVALGEKQTSNESGAG